MKRKSLRTSDSLRRDYITRALVLELLDHNSVQVLIYDYYTMSEFSEKGLIVAIIEPKPGKGDGVRHVFRAAACFETLESTF
jgi:hypothetical protein